MVNPNIPNMPNIPGMGAMTDTLDFVKNLWGSMGLPGMNMTGMPMSGMPGMPGMNMTGMVMPTLSVEEINKKITDLKAVESWLGLNMNMLRGTIQALEVQAATIATLQSMGETFAATMNPASKDKPTESRSAVSPNGSDASNGSNGASGSHATERLHHHAPEPTSKDESDAASLTAPLVNAAAWWNMLQDQFKQAVNTAMTETAQAATAPVSETPKAKAAAKPKASSSSSSASASTAASSATRKRKTTK